VTRFPTLALAIVVAHCGSSSLSAAHRAFDEARYADAIADFRRAEPALAHSSPAELTRYALYRGLTHLALGDSRSAEYWLEFAKQRSERDPELLNSDDRGRLSAAWRSMGKMPGQ